MNKSETIPTILNSSFRDPSGFLFESNGELYRYISNSYKENFECFLDSGLFEYLQTKRLIIENEKVDSGQFDFENCHKIYKPQLIPFISYPYEWSFSALKEAALLTLKIQKIALDYNMSLKDASAYNIQFIGTKPIFIDLLSFKKYEENSPWKAYKQFCQHFLAPLLLSSYKEPELKSLLLDNIDGIPLALASKLLPKKTFFNFSIFSHIHLNAYMQKSYQNKTVKNSDKIKLSKQAQINLINDLENLIKKLKLPENQTEWANYYDIKNYDEDSFNHKKQLLCEYLKVFKHEQIIDLGANTGVFSEIAEKHAETVVSCDMDYQAVEFSYKNLQKENNKKILPLVIDLCNPSPSIGWHCQERTAFFERIGNDKTIIALALIHHLRISNNVPIKKLAGFFSTISKNLIIEFVPKEDSMVKKLLSTREDVFDDYSITVFEEEFSKYFNIIKSSPINNSQRILYLMQRK